MSKKGQSKTRSTKPSTERSTEKSTVDTIMKPTTPEDIREAEPPKKPRRRKTATAEPSAPVKPTIIGAIMGLRPKPTGITAFLTEHHAEISRKLASGVTWEQIAESIRAYEGDDKSIPEATRKTIKPRTLVSIYSRINKMQTKLPAGDDGVISNASTPSSTPSSETTTE